MADDPQDFRDPKVTTSSKTQTPATEGGLPKWLPMVIGALLLLLILAWLFGLFADDEAETATVEGDAVVVTD